MGLCLILSLGACTTAQPDPPVVASTSTNSGLTADTLPDTQGNTDACPYVDAEWLANTNGQRVLSQGIDTRFDPPACVFWSYGEQPQATVLIRQMPSKSEAYQVVDWAAPIASTDPVDQAGWSGGRGVTDSGSVYAVSKDTTAVVVFSDQQQTIKAQLIAEEAIKNLGL